MIQNRLVYVVAFTAICLGASAKSWTYNFVAIQSPPVAILQSARIFYAEIQTPFPEKITWSIYDGPRAFYNLKSNIDKITRTGDQLSIDDSGVNVFFSKDNYKQGPEIKNLEKAELDWKRQIQKVLKQPEKDFFWKQGTTKKLGGTPKSNAINFYSFKLQHRSLPIFPPIPSFFRCSRVTGKIVQAILGNPPKLQQVAVSHLTAIQIAQETSKRVRKQFPRPQKINKLVGPISPRFVIHGSNGLANPDLIKLLIKQGYKSAPTDEYRIGSEYHQSPYMALCWMVNIDGDICLVNANTGKVHYYRYAEMGPYFTIDKGNNLVFNSASR